MTLVPAIVASLWAKSQAADRVAEESALAASLSRLRYDPPSINVWSLLKTLLILIPVLLVCFWIGKAKIRQAILRQFVAEQEHAQQVQLQKDRAAVAAHDRQLADLRQLFEAELDAAHKQDGINLARIQSLEGALRTAGGWTPEVVSYIDGTPAPRFRKPTVTKRRAK